MTTLFDAGAVGEDVLVVEMFYDRTAGDDADESYVKDAIRPVIGSSVANSVPERPAEVPTETPKILQDEEPLPAATEPAKGFAPAKNKGPVKRPKSDVQRKNEQSREERENLSE